MDPDRPVQKTGGTGTEPGCRLRYGINYLTAVFFPLVVQTITSDFWGTKP